MAVNAFTSNQGTQTPILTDNTGGTAGTVIPVFKMSFDGQGTYTDANLFQGTLPKVNTIGTLPNLPGGSISVTTGTVNTGTINTGTVNLGSVVKITPASSAGSFTAAGSVVVTGSQLDYAAFDIGGTWVGTVFTEGQIGTSAWFAIPYASNLGAIGTSFTGNGDYFVSMAALDGVRARLTYSSGTLTYNARQSNFFAPVHYNLGGSIGNVGMVNAATVSSLPNLPGGSIVVTTGTQNAGTVNTGTVNTGTINTGTINVGTFRLDGRTTQNILTYGTQIANIGAAAATVVGSSSVGAGTYLWLQDVSVTNSLSSLATVILGFGTTQQGTNVLLRATLGTSGAVGIEKSLAKAVNAGMTNQDLVFSTTGAGTVDLTFSYFISA